jgi:hypothetical protein
MHGVGIDVGGVGVRASLVHEPVQHGWNISHARLCRSSCWCRTTHGVIAIALAWLVGLLRYAVELDHVELLEWLMKT